MEWRDLGITPKPGHQRSSTPCPECSHKRKKKTDPCLTINNEPGNRWFKCNHCLWSGNLESMERYQKVRENSGMPKDMRVERVFSQKFNLYLKNRGLSIRTATKMMVYEDSKGNVGFPYIINHDVVNVKFLSGYEDPLKKKWWQLKQEYGTKKCFWGMQELAISKDPLRQELNKVIITEGEWDTLTWKEVKVDNAISVPDGAPSKEAKDFDKKFTYVFEPYFQREIAKYVDVFYLCTDADDQGQVLMHELAKRLGKHRCMIIRYPKGYKDINEVLNGNKKKKLAPLGPQGVKECLEEAKPYPISGIIRVSDLRYEMEQYQKEGIQPGLKTGIPELDHIFTVKRGHNTFLTGVPGMGKSVWLKWYLTRLSKNNEEVKFGLFDPENRPVSRSYVKMAELLTKKRYQEGYHDSMLPEERINALNYLEKHFIQVAPDKSKFEDFDGSVKRVDLNKLESILKYFAYLKKTENIFGYVIDAYNKLDNDPPGYLTETKFIEKQLDYIFDFNAYHDLHGWIIAHPTKMQKDKNGNYMMPSLYDIKGSSSWYEKVDIGLAIHRYKFQEIKDSDLTIEEARMKEESPAEFAEMKLRAREKTITYLKCEKIRQEELGTEGILKFDFLPYNDFRINSLDKGYHERVKKINESEEEPDAVDQFMPFADPDDDEELPF